jgi:hypothetical protein
MAKLYVAEVRNIGGEDKAGYVQVRKYGYQDNEDLVKDDDLPWGTPLQPVTSAATGRVGVAPNGLRVGSRVAITFAENDPEEKHPIILGPYARSAPPKNSDSQQRDNTTGKDQAKKDVKNGDSPASVEKLPKNHANVNLGQKPNTEKPKYGNVPVKTKDDGVDGHSKAREKYAPKAEDKTTAGAEKGLKDLNAAIMATGAVASQVLPGLVSAMAIVSMLMKSNSSSGAQNETTQNALVDALKYLSNKLGFQFVLDEFNRALSNGGFKNLSPRNQEIVQEAVSKLIQDVSSHGKENELPHFTPTPTIIKIDIGVPVPLPIVGVAPDLYVRQYYNLGENPYPGFVQWKGPNGDFVYTNTPRSEPTYQNIQEHIYDMAFSGLGKTLEPYIVNKRLTSEILDKSLNSCVENIKNTGMEAALGKGSSSNLMSLLPALLGGLSGAISLTQAYLPESVLSVGSINTTLAEYSRAMALTKFMSNTTASAFGVPSALSGLAGGLGGLAGGALGGLGGLAGGALGGLGDLGGLAGGLGGGIAGGLGGSITGALTGNLAGQVTGALGEAIGLSGDSIKGLSTIAGAAAGYSVAKATTLVGATSSLEQARIQQASIYSAQRLLWSVL